MKMPLQQFDIKASYILSKPTLNEYTNDLILSDTESIISNIEEEEEEIIPVQVDTKNIKLEQNEDNFTFQQYFKDVLSDIETNLKVEPFTKTSSLMDDEDWGWEDDLSITDTYYLPKFIIKLIELDIKNKKMFIIIMNILLLKIYKLYGISQFTELYRLLDYSMDNYSGIANLVKDNIVINTNNLIDLIDYNNILKCVDNLVIALPLDSKLIKQNEMLCFTLEILENRFNHEIGFLLKRKIIEWYKDSNKKMNEDVLERLNRL
ncbi:hypothetical protein FOG51_02417 [Hanseniaspora uvarum]|nr:hypothetical protein FOG48_02227 [Hanseniaspora uvarum]KAF0272693.1 hypothetical protein FOG51_02417 [Hanseniaspora uvarum]